MNVTFKVGETPRVYVERIDITGNTTTRDKVIRREFRLNEGDAFNALKVKRSQDRIQSLGYFQDKLEIKQTEGSTPDRVVLGVNVEEKPTGQLSLSGGYSSLERFVVQLAVAQNNFMGKGQQLDRLRQLFAHIRNRSSSASPTPISWTSRSCSAASFSAATTTASTFIGNQRNTTYSQVSTGGGLRMGFPVTEYWTFGTPLLAARDKSRSTRPPSYDRRTGRCVRSAQGGRAILRRDRHPPDVVFGYSAALRQYRRHPADARPTRFVLSQDFAGLGGDVKYLRTRVDATKYKSFGGGWVVSLHAEGGYIKALQKSPGPGRDAIRLTDRFFGPQLRGFDIRGIGPRIERIPYDSDWQR